MPVVNALPDSLVSWIVAALLLFWFVGAYNRLMRLRSAALQSYATLDAALVRQLEFTQAESSAAEESAGDAAGEDASTRASLRAATAQLTTLLAGTRLQPLDPERIAALGTALRALLSAWQRQHPDSMVSFDADGMLSRPAPLGGIDEAPSANMPIAWPEPSAAAEIARSHFNLAVRAYNQGIGQFPALLVAWIMRLRPAAPLL
ncbi:LemA family protein [Variovorax sp. PAMC 28711]|uniref:LemA family protein n=1 Tax=Variovorax sp. PAMC 28711 TaxID=1795631 RepID=UPI001F3008AC|nr:LemA family protein [Variovorax sp. PAMC 28711]